MDRYTYEQTLMGTKVSLQFFKPNDDAAQLIFTTIKQLEDKLTVNRSISEVMSINHAAGQHTVRVSPFVFSLIEQAKQVSLAKDSCFNVAIGAVVKLWKIGFKGNTLPTNEQIQQRLLLTQPHLIKLNKSEHSVFLQKKGMEIDLGAIAKGYIADVVKALLYEHDIKQGIIDLGGNVLTLGKSPLNSDGNWHIGLQKPFSSVKKSIAAISVKDKSIVTSGIYERFFVQNGKIYHHILDPKTGYPLDNELLGVTIISNSSLEGDIYSTYLYGLGIKKAQQYLQNHPGIGAIFVSKDKKITLINLSQSDFRLFDNKYQVNLH